VSAEAVPELIERLAYGNHTRVRCAAAWSLAWIGRRLPRRDAIREALEKGLDDPDFRVILAASEALRTLGDDAALAALTRAREHHVDGRIRKSAEGAVRAIQRRGEGATESARIADDLETLRKRNAELLARLERLEARMGAAPPSP
jgi:aminopeptidase N